MANKITVSLISEYGLVGLNYEKSDMNGNLSRIINFLGSELTPVLSDKPDIIILPELCDRFERMSDSDQIEWFKFRKNTVRDYLSDVARENNCYIAYSSVRDGGDGRFRNSTQMIDRNGKICGIYDKIHLVPHEYDNRNISYGTEATVMNLDFGDVACAICFDLNFPDIRRSYVSQKPKLVVFSSFFHGGILQQQWAYDCQSFFAGAIFKNQSRVLNPFGQEVSTTTNYRDFTTARINLDYEIVHIDRNERKINEAKLKYGSSLTVLDPGNIGSVMLSYEDNDKTAMDIVKEFDMLLLDDYFDVCNIHRSDRV